MCSRILNRLAELESCQKALSTSRNSTPSLSPPPDGYTLRASGTGLRFRSSLDLSPETQACDKETLKFPKVLEDMYEPPLPTPISGFPGGSDGKESACNARDLGSIPGSGRSPGEGNSYPLHYSRLDNSKDRGSGEIRGTDKSLRGEYHRNPDRKTLICWLQAMPP